MFSNTFNAECDQSHNRKYLPKCKSHEISSYSGRKYHWRDNLEPRNAILTTEHDRKQMTLHKVKEYTLVNY